MSVEQLEMRGIPKEVADEIKRVVDIKLRYVHQPFVYRTLV